MFEEVVTDPHNDIAKHVNEAAVSIKGKPGIACFCGESCNHSVIESQVEDSVHHPRH